MKTLNIRGEEAGENWCCKEKKKKDSRKKKSVNFSGLWKKNISRKSTFFPQKIYSKRNVDSPHLNLILISPPFQSKFKEDEDEETRKKGTKKYESEEEEREGDDRLKKRLKRCNFFECSLRFSFKKIPPPHSLLML